MSIKVWLTWTAAAAAGDAAGAGSASRWDRAKRSPGPPFREVAEGEEVLLLAMSECLLGSRGDGSLPPETPAWSRGGSIGGGGAPWPAMKDVWGLLKAAGVAGALWVRPSLATLAPASAAVVAEKRYRGGGTICRRCDLRFIGWRRMLPR
mmetsp:Transcript_7142/g.20251  ORF Transcript_7142/g.20251 Transcript_7142/m.20251 type:complete len:150 (-) Transcript_7142:1150-1599(-)